MVFSVLCEGLLASANLRQISLIVLVALSVLRDLVSELATLSSFVSKLEGRDLFFALYERQDFSPSCVPRESDVHDSLLVSYLEYESSKQARSRH